MRKMFISIMSNWPLTMDLIQILSLRTLKKVNTPLHLLCQIAQLIRVSRKLWRQHCLRFAIGNILLSWFNLDRQKYDHTAKTTDEQKLIPRKQSWTRTSVKQWTLPLTANLMRHKYLDLMRLKIPFCSTLVPPTYVQVNGEDFGKVVENNWLPMGINGRVWAWPMVKLAFTTQKSQSFICESQSWIGKNKAFNSQFIWTTLSISGQQHGPTS